MDIVLALLVLGFFFLLFKGVQAMKKKVEEKQNNNRFNFSFSKYGNLLVINIGSSYDVNDYEFFVNILNAPLYAKESQEMLQADQLLIDFSNCNHVDSMGTEFLVLHYDYLQKKGKEVFFCGITKEVDSVFRSLFEADYMGFKKFDNKEKAIEYHLSNQVQT